MSGDRLAAIIVAMDEELAPFRALVGGWQRLTACAPWEAYEGRIGRRRVALLVSDCGPVNAGSATERVILQLRPEVILNGGSAGAHDPELRPGDVVIGSRCCILYPPALQDHRRRRGLHPKQIRFRRDGRRVHVPHLEADPAHVARALIVAGEELPRFAPWDGPGWPASEPRRPGRAITGTIGSTDAWHVDADDIRAHREVYGTACEDMESAFVAQVCALHAIPFLAVRAISDNEAAARLPEAEVLPAIAAAGVRAAAVLARLAAEI
ncbi:MAG: 5'-methylthioadenosine/S-adenosylhomocysteine nucleosidase [Thermoanaerobaculaceae bacterium]|jgi:adenosylhomocysteine nucleosidase|nr:5'-methylthioadenosine/S-adenosylhomocysteine nucleosidase [Thermoanaerobaculaceae bacterium]